MSKTLNAAGFDVGHETLGTDGTSNWLAASPQYPIKPYQFDVIVLAVRHPLRVLRSCRATNWNFDVEFHPIMVGKDITRDLEVSTSVFHSLSHDFKCLEWWNSFTMLGHNIASCWFSTDTITPSLIRGLCQVAGFDSCDKKNFEQLVRINAGYNKHAESTARNATWDELETIASATELQVLKRSRTLCTTFSLDEC